MSSREALPPAGAEHILQRLSVPNWTWVRGPQATFAVSEGVTAGVAAESCLDALEVENGWSVVAVDPRLARDLSSGDVPVWPCSAVDEPAAAARTWFAARRREVAQDPEGLAWLLETRSALDALDFEAVAARPPRSSVKDGCRLVLLPTAPGLVLSMIGFGGWNDVPAERGHAVLMSYWAERWGARPLYVAAPLLELYVERPPSTLEEVRELTWEHALYSLELHEDVDSYARRLVRSHLWTFAL